MSNLITSTSIVSPCFLATTHNQESVIKQDLELWCREKEGTYEYTRRQEASRRILDAYSNNLNTLDLEDLDLSSLPRSLGNLSLLTKLNLSNNQLQNLPAELGNLSLLTELNLSINKLQSLPAELGNLSLLTELNLRNNKLQSLPAELGNLSLLTELNLRSNKLQSLPAELGNLSLLTELNLSTNELQSLPAELGNLSLLTKLNLCDNQLQSLPTELENLSLLTELNLSFNDLESPPAELGNLSLLTKLNLSNNQLQSLPTELGDLSLLTKLNLSFNQLQSLPAELENLSLLTKLNLSSNELQSLPAELGNLSLLTELNLSSNQLQSLPAELVQLSSSCEVNLEYNQLSVATIQTFQETANERRRTHLNQGPRFIYSIYDASPVVKSPETLEQVLTLWIQESGEEVDLSSYQSLISHDQADMLMIFLNKLRRTEDFMNVTSRPGVIKLVNQMLKDTCTNEVFQEKMFLLLHDANDTCCDRTTITLGRMELEWRFTCNLENADAPSLAKLIIGYNRLELLNKIVDKKVAEKRLGDAIETKLRYQMDLKEALGLPISTSNMLYRAMSGVSPKDVEEARLEILNKTSSVEDQADILLKSERGSEAWINLLKKEHPKAFEEVVEFYAGKLNDLDYTMPLNEYMDKMNAIVERQKQKTEQLVRDITVQYLKPSELQ